jgi:hypothetical protein
MHWPSALVSDLLFVLTHQLATTLRSAPPALSQGERRHLPLLVAVVSPRPPFNSALTAQTCLHTMLPLVGDLAVCLMISSYAKPRV